MKSLFFKFHAGNARGQALVFLPFLIVALIVTGGLVVDTANAFLTKAKLRRALDASAMAGIVRYSNGFTDAETIRTDAEDLLRYNLNQMGIPDERITEAAADFTIDENQVGTLELSGRIEFPTIFMRFIPDAGLEFSSVAASAVSRRFPAVISLVLDTSGSMEGSKLESLKIAAHAFVDSFQEGIDQMALIHFGTTATLLQPMALIDQASLHALIDDLETEGWTNISEGVSIGRMQIEAADDPDAEFEPVKAILLFTDGAPNVFRGIFTRPKTPPLVNNFPLVGPEDADMYLNPGNYPTLVQNGLNLNTLCYGTGGWWGYGTDIRHCYETLEYKDSRLNIRPGSHLISRTSRTEQLREAYRLAIVEADYAKADGTTVYSVGLGTQAWENNDPYQDATDFNPIKSYLLRRIANDPGLEEDPSFPGLANPANHPRGIYLQTPDPDDLTELFQTVANKLKSRLVE